MTAANSSGTVDGPGDVPAGRRLALVTLVVREYDEAIDWFTGRLDFKLVEDTQLKEPQKRWVVVQPGCEPASALLLARAADATQRACIGQQTGGRVGFFLHTDDFWRDYRNFAARGVRFVREPVAQSYGTVAVFADLYGNLWDLIEPGHAT
ncbi:MAG: VOC family protein [Pseudomonadota bacterium]